MQYSVQYNTGDEVRCRCHNMSTKINVILYCVTVRVCVHNYTIQYNIIFYAWSISIPRSLVAGNPCVREKRLVCDIFSFDSSSHHRCSRFEYRYPAEYSSWQNALFLSFFSTRRRRWLYTHLHPVSEKNVGDVLVQTQRNCLKLGTGTVSYLAIAPPFSP